METNEQNNLWDIEYYQRKNQGAMMVTLGWLGRDVTGWIGKCHLCQKREGESSGQQEPMGSWL